MPANGTGSQDALEDDPEYDPRKSRSRGFDPPPIWDGIDPASTWKSTRRSLHLWAADQTGLPAEVLGVRVFRHSLCGKAKLLADEIEDDDLKASDGFEKIIAFFDGLYAGHIKLEDEKIMDNALYTGKKKDDETFIEYTARKQVELRKLAKLHKIEDGFPETFQGKVLLSQSGLSQRQKDMILTWSNAVETARVLVPLLNRLDLPEYKDLGSGSKTYHTDDPENFAANAEVRDWQEEDTNYPEEEDDDENNYY